MLRDYHARDFPGEPPVPDCVPLSWGWLEDMLGLRLLDAEDAKDAALKD